MAKSFKKLAGFVFILYARAPVRVRVRVCMRACMIASVCARTCLNSCLKLSVTRILNLIKLTNLEIKENTGISLRLRNSRARKSLQRLLE